MKNKAILLPEALKLFIALVVLVFLIYLAYQLYGIFIVKTEIEQARETLKQIVGKMENLQEGEQIEYLVTAPKDWYLVSYNKNKLEEKPSGIKRKAPKQCQDKDCLCICPEGEDLENKNVVERSVIDVVSKQITKFIAVTEENIILEYFYKDGVEECQNKGICVGKDIFIRHEHKYVFWYAVGPLPVYRKDKAIDVNWISFYNIPKAIILKKEKNLLIEENEK